MADIDVRALLLGWRGAKPTGNIPSYLIGKKIADIATVESSGPVAHTAYGKADAPLKKLVVQIKARQAGSGDPSPENEREISGWSAVEISHTGINECDEQFEIGGYYAGQKDDTVTNKIRTANPISVIPGASYYYYNGSGKATQKFFYDADGEYLRAGAASQAGDIINIPEDVYYMNLALAVAYGTEYKHDVSINFPSTETGYNAFNGGKETIALGKTVYGAELDALTGEMTEDYDLVDLSTLSWEVVNGSWSVSGFSQAAVPADSSTPADIKAERYKTVAQVDIDASSNQIALTPSGDLLCNNGSTTAGDEPTGNLLFKRAAPITVQLTPIEPLTTVAGENYVWANSGDVDVIFSVTP